MNAEHIKRRWCTRHYENMNVLDEEVHGTMYPTDVVLGADGDDLAVISMAEEDPKKDDSIMCIGNLQNEWFRRSKGKVTFGIEKCGESTGYPSNVMEHNAYMHVGGSSGAAENAQMKLAGITTTASISPGSNKFVFGTLIPLS